MIHHGDSLDVLKEIPDESVDVLVTDPPYGYSFMGKSWDKALPDIGIFKECFRTLKPGAFAFVMSAPRSDVCSRMAILLEDAGFNIAFTPIYWTYASGFPKAMNIGKMVDKRGGEYLEADSFRLYMKERREAKGLSLKELNAEFGYVAGCNWWEAKGDNFRVPNNEDYKKLKSLLELDDRFDTLVGATGEKIGEKTRGNAGFSNESVPRPWKEKIGEPVDVTARATDAAKALDGSYGGFQPKPAVEVVIVAMKPLSEKTYVDQALKNGKGITWLDDCRIPTEENLQAIVAGIKSKSWREAERRDDIDEEKKLYGSTNGRFPANLLVSDDVLNDGKITKSMGGKGRISTDTDTNLGGGNNYFNFGDSGGYSRFFSLDAWAQTLPFLAVPKASKSEKNAGLTHLPDRASEVEHGNIGRPVSVEKRREAQDGKNAATMKNHHPTVKPLKLMSYLITLGSRAGDTVLDPFLGSGTTAVAAKQLGRNFIGIEREAEYVEIAEARIKAVIPTLV